MAKETGDLDDIVYSIQQVITNCAITPVDVKQMPMFDLEYFFLRLRAKSINEVVLGQFVCTNKKDGKTCDNVVKIPIELEALEVSFPEKDLSVVKVTDSIGLKLKYPRFELIHKIIEVQQHPDDYELGFDIIADCVESVYEGDKVHTRFEKKEIVEFLEKLPIDKYAQIEEFLSNAPTIKKDLDFKCNKCGYQTQIHLEGLQSFFG